MESELAEREVGAGLDEPSLWEALMLAQADGSPQVVFGGAKVAKPPVDEANGEPELRGLAFGVVVALGVEAPQEVFGAVVVGQRAKKVSCLLASMPSFETAR